MFTAKSDGVGVKTYLPDENKVVLANGRTIEYDHLVIGTGLKHDVGLVDGLANAWKTYDIPVHVAKDHPDWRANEFKFPRWHFNYTSGDAIFCIPPYPYAGEIECFNFFASTEIWKYFANHGKLSPLHQFTVINANESFCHHNASADQYIKSELPKRGVKVELGLNLKAVDPKTQIATFENVKTGETS